MRTTADLIADLVPPPIGVYTQARTVLEEHTASICALLTDAQESAVLPPISDDFILALRAESRGGEMAVSAALPLVTAAANIGELEMTYQAEMTRETVS